MKCIKESVNLIQIPFFDRKYAVLWYNTYIEKTTENDMFHIEEELKKFHPSLEIEEAEDAIYNQDLTDMADLLVSLVKEEKEEAAAMAAATAPATTRKRKSTSQ